ncbi:phospholipase, patatin family [Dictyocaulus viviparus]|uniref:Phospholipase, patatin family n=1 Tax=Dictyocaulus viviparus TaxID=29172 RepID=A0A0D8XMR1_DICVI|nr:phospholipase, patatin family [Dictyocaulus viviparus]
MDIVNSDPGRMNLSFSGCGFLCVYHAGVAAAIKEYAPFLMENRISGASAGAIVAACLVTNVCLSKATSTILKVVSQARSRSLGPLHPEFNLLDLVREEISHQLPPGSYKRCNGRLQISLTRWKDSKNIVISDFNSDEELIDAIICSCYIPVFCGNTPPSFRGEMYIDGGFTDNQPSFDDHTITVSPFSGESDICPVDWHNDGLFGLSFSRTSIRFSSLNLYRMAACLMPLSTDDCAKICVQGFDDGVRFLTKVVMPCIRCLTIQTSFIKGVTDFKIPSLDSVSSSVRSSFNKTKSAALKGKVVLDCTICKDSDRLFSSASYQRLPAFLVKAFDEAYAAEESRFKFLFSFRLFRYARTAFGLWMLPLDLGFVYTKRFARWLSRMVVPEWLSIQLQAVITFVLDEIEHQKSRCTEFSCMLPPPRNSIRKGDLEIELSEDAKKELKLLRESDKKRIQDAANFLEWKILSDDEDSLYHVIEYSNSHDAMYEFHYLDENNHLRTVEFFNIANPSKRHKCHSHIRDVSALSQSSSAVMRKHECEGKKIEEGLGCPKEDEEGDSGLSDVEGHTNRKESFTVHRILEFLSNILCAEMLLRMLSVKKDNSLSYH